MKVDLEYWLSCWPTTSDFMILHVLQNCKQQRPFNGPLSGTTRVSRYQKGKTNLDLLQWYQLGHMQICTSHQTYIHASTYHSVF